MTRVFFLLIGLLLGAHSNVSAASYDLEAAVKRGLESNPEIISRKIAVQESNREIDKAQSLFMPSVSLTHQDNTLSNSKASLAESREYPDQTDRLTSLRLTQPLFLGFAGVNTLEKAKYLREFRDIELQEARLALARDIKRQFFEYLRLVADIETAKATIHGLEKHLKVATAYYEKEMAPKLQVLQAEVRLSSAKQALVQVETQADNARRRLNELLAVSDGESDADYVGRLEDFAFQIDTPLQDYASPAQSRPTVQLAMINVTLSRVESRLVLSRALPRVSLDANYNDRTVDYKYAGYTGINEDYWTVGVSMSMNLFQGGSDVAEYRQQQLAASRHEEDLRKLRNGIDRELAAAYASLEEALKRIEAASKNKEVALEALEAARKSFELGIGTTTTVLDAQQEATQAMANLARARSDFLLSRATLEYLAVAHDSPALDDGASDEGISLTASPSGDPDWSP